MTGELHAHVRVGYGAGFRLDASLSAPAGSTVAVMGPSGAGKSTLLAALAGLLRVDDGEVVVDGAVLSSPTVHVAAARRGTVLLGQQPLLFPHLSALENVAFGPRAAGVPVRDARLTAHRWLSRVGLDGAHERRPDELSGGQQQRVAVARALAASPRLVLLDEPFTSLDPVTAGDLRAMLAPQLEGRTCVVVTHDAADAVALAESLVVIEEGRVTQSGPIRGVLGAPATGFVAAIADFNRVPGVASAGDCVVAGIRFPGSAGSIPDGTAVVAAFRPGDVAIVADDGPARGGRWRARVERIDHTVAGVRVRTVGPLVVAVDAPAGTAVSVGDEVTLELAASRVRVFAVAAPPRPSW